MLVYAEINQHYEFQMEKKDTALNPGMVSLTPLILHKERSR